MVKNMLALAAVVLLMGAGPGWARETVKKFDTKEYKTQKKEEAKKNSKKAQKPLADNSKKSSQKTDKMEKKTTQDSTDDRTTSTNDQKNTQPKENNTTPSTDTTSGGGSASDASKGQCTPGVHNIGKDCDKVGYAPMKGLGAVRNPTGTSVPSGDKTINPLSEAIVVTGLAPDQKNNQTTQITSQNSSKGETISTKTLSSGSSQESNTCNSGASPTIDSSLKKLSCNCPQGTYTFSKDYEITCETSKPNCSGNETLVQNSSTGIYTCGKKS